MRDDLKPLRWPSPPDISDMQTDEAREVVEAYLSEIEYITIENQRRGSRALWRVRLCGLVHGMLYAGYPNISQNRHFKWCPGPYWVKDWR